MIRLVQILAAAYPLALLSIILVLRYVGERWWFSTIVLYLPRAGFGLPLPFLIIGLALCRQWKWLFTRGAACLLLLFCLMGLRAGLGKPWSGHADRLRLLSFNIDLGSRGIDAISALIRSVNPDIACLQEGLGDEAKALGDRLPGYSIRSDGQFLLATRYPIRAVFVPQEILDRQTLRTVRYIRYTLQSPAGVVQVYSWHPVSVHASIEQFLGQGVLAELTSKRLFMNKKAVAALNADTFLRAMQIRLLAQDAAQSPFPVIIAGDTNQPGLSWLFEHWLGEYQDGFAEVGVGFGYTYPAHARRKWMLPWMRLDRILADKHFRFIAFDVLQHSPSDHLAIVADLELLPVDGTRH